jgi:alginate O-acetyltransferase complex protein AlgJ
MTRRRFQNLSAKFFFCVLLAASAVSYSDAADQQIYEASDGWLFPAWESVSVFEQKEIDANLDLFKRAQTLFAARGIRIFFLIVPSKAVFYADRQPPDHIPSAAIQNRYRYILNGMQRAGLSAPDIQTALRTVEHDGMTAFYRTDYHWTSYGAEAAAEVIAQAILQSDIALNGHAGTGAKLGKWRNERHYGDLAQRYLSAQRRAQLGRDLFAVRRTAETQENLLDDEPATVQVLGNSFVQSYWGFSQKLSNQIDRPVALSWKVGNVGQWMNLLSYAEASDFSQAAPQIIVWQMNEAQIELGPQDTRVWDAQSQINVQQWLARLGAALNKS